MSEKQDEFEAIISRTRMEYRTVGNMVTSVIREGIVTAVLRPGEHLRQDELARRLNVSRMPVRSALLQLESEGLVEFRPHRGAVVARLDASHVRQIYEIRIHLETLAIEKAISTMTPERLAGLEELATHLDLANEGDRWIGLRVKFYDELYDKERNPRLVSLIERLRSDVGRYWLRLRLTGDAQTDTHRELLRLVRERDVSGAQHYLREHLNSVCDRLCDLIEATPQHGNSAETRAAGTTGEGAL